MPEVDASPIMDADGTYAMVSLGVPIEFGNVRGVLSLPLSRGEALDLAEQLTTWAEKVGETPPHEAFADLPFERLGAE